ncbi:MAG TPA: family 10 glycosylhydrolase [Gemmatimonadaceae bacterium]|nr:family 10 glycosylhydrolase [Gemmatimonadaceae bacterium]
MSHSVAVLRARIALPVLCLTLVVPAVAGAQGQGDHPAVLQPAVAAATSRPMMAEARALWVTRFDYNSEAKIIHIMETAARANFNIVYFQARAAGDAYYRSSIEPCAVLLCGKLGGTPSYDPLEVAVREGHKRGLQVHAYLNALSARAAGIEGKCRPLTESDPGNPRHMLLDHPEWVMTDRSGKPLPCPNSEEYVWLSPAFAGVRQRLAAVAADVARRYEVDGIHLDRIRYPGAAWSHDAASREQFAKNPDLYPAEWRSFRTGLVNAMVKETYDSIQAVKPGLVMSAAVWGVYDDIWNWRTLAGATDLMQDGRSWAREGYMDILVPMTYYRINQTKCSRIDWACVLEEHLEGDERATGRHMYIGIDASKGAREVLNQVRLARSRGVSGIAIFSFTDAENARVWPLLSADLFAQPAAIPEMPWKTKAVQ